MVLRPPGHQLLGTIHEIPSHLDDGWKPTARFTVTPEAYYLETCDRQPDLPHRTDRPDAAPAGDRDVRAAEEPRFRGVHRSPVPGDPDVETAGNIYFGAAQPVPGPTRQGHDSDTLWRRRTRSGTRSVQGHLAGVYLERQQGIFRNTPMPRCSGQGSSEDTSSPRPSGSTGGSACRSSGRTHPQRTTRNKPRNDPAGTDHPRVFGQHVPGEPVRERRVFRAQRGGRRLTRQGTVGINLADQFTQRWSWSLGGNYQISRTVFAATSSGCENVERHRQHPLRPLGMGIVRPHRNIPRGNGRTFRTGI